MYTRRWGSLIALMVGVLGLACGGDGGGPREANDAGPIAIGDGGDADASDTGPGDAPDATLSDAGDAGPFDAGDAAPAEAGPGDGGADAGPVVVVGAAMKIGGTDLAGADPIYPRLSVERAGNALAVWTAVDGIRASRYAPGSGWTTATRVDSDPGGAFSPAAAIGAGTAVVTWVAEGGRLWANRSTAAGAWEGAQPITSDFSETPSVAVDAAGNALVVFVVRSLPPSTLPLTTVWSLRYTPTGAWETAVYLQGEGARPAQRLRLALDDSGHAAVVWLQQAPGAKPDELWSNRYVPGTGWGTATRLDTGEVVVAAPQVTIDRSGSALVAWSVTEQGTTSIWSTRYVPGTGWSAASLVKRSPTASHSTYGFRLQGDSLGNALVVYLAEAKGDLSIWWNHHSVASGWGTAAQLVSGLELWSDPILSMGAAGHAVVLWTPLNQEGFRLRRYTSATGWSAPAQLDKGNRDMTLALDDSGAAFAAWEEPRPGNPSEIWANRF